MFWLEDLNDKLRAQEHSEGGLDAEPDESDDPLAPYLLDKPEDRLWHDADGTWWRREGDRLVRADAPPRLITQWDQQKQNPCRHDAGERYSLDQDAMECVRCGKVLGKR